MTIPDYETLMLPILREAVVAEEIRTGSLVPRMAEEFGLTDTERAQLVPSGGKTVILDRTHWAITYLAKAGLLERTRRGYVRVTPRGREILDERPARIDGALLARFPEFRAFKSARRVKLGEMPEGTADAVPAATPAEAMRAAHEEANAALRSEVLEQILARTPAFFEQMVVRLLSAMGFGAVAEVTGGSGDGGLDGVINQDVLGLDRVYVQAKRYGRDRVVGPNSIRDFFGGLDLAKAAKGVFITTSAFSSQAVETAAKLGKRIVLIDGDKLADLMIKHDVGVRIEETFHIKKIDEDFFPEE